MRKRNWCASVGAALPLVVVLLGGHTGCKRHSPAPAEGIGAEPANADPERSKFQGTWKHLSIDLNGRQAAPHVAAGFVYRFDGTSYSITDNGIGRVTTQGSYKLDPGASPPAIDFAESGGVMIYGVYRFEGDRLTICMHEQRRPTEFESRPGQGRSMVVLERQK